MTSNSRASWRGLLMATTALLGVASFLPRGAEAQLSGLSVSAGHATVSTPSATQTVVTQTTSKAILNWQSFSIASGTGVEFVQPSAGSIALNRVTSGNPSTILGSLTANGQVWLVNPNGVLFGRGAQVDVGGLIATTSDIRDSDFLSGTYTFGLPSPNASASVANQGRIKVESGGTAALMGAQVDNEGLIEADFGSVVLAGGKTFAVNFSGNGLLSFQVTTPVDQKPANGQALVTNGGTLQATGGKVLLTARAAKDIVDNVINSTGIVEATSVHAENGTIVFDGGDGGVQVSGAVDASGKAAGQTGGTVEVLGGSVSLANDARIDVSGDQGGGTVLVGGNFHGAGPQQNALTTTISAGVVIAADAITAGAGGQVAIWSEAQTEMDGTITARGGASGGNGGFVETSSHGNLGIGPTAVVDAGAANSASGTWLLDPADVTIGNSTGNVSPGAITGALTNNGVIVDTTGTQPGSNGNIFVNASLVYLSGNPLSLLAQGNITVSQTVSNAGTGAINLVSGWDGSTGLTPGTSTEFNAGNTGGTASGNTVSMAAIETTFGTAKQAFGSTGAAGGGGDISISTTLGTQGALTLLGNNVVDTRVNPSSTSAATFGIAGVTVFAVSGVTMAGSVGAAGFGNASGGPINGGNISIVANGDINIDTAATNAAITADGGDRTSGAGGSGSGGSVTLTSNQGSVVLGGSALARGGDVLTGGSGAAGNAGSVTIQGTNVTVQGSSGNNTINARGGRNSVGGSGGSAGAVSITATSGSILLSVTSGDLGINTEGGDAPVSGSGGNAGAVTLSATADISIGTSSGNPSISTRGGEANAGAGGNGAAITMNAGGSITTDGAVLSLGGDALLGAAGSTAGGAGGNGGAISLTASSGNISIGTTNTTTTTSLGTNSSFISVLSRGGDTDGSAGGGTGGAITLSAPSGSILAGIAVPNGQTPGLVGNVNTVGSSVDSRGGDDITTGSPGFAGLNAALGTPGGIGGAGGTILVTAGGDISFGTITGDQNAAMLSQVVARGGDAQGGSGALLGIGGNAAPITISGGAELNLAGVFARGGNSATGATAVGNGANISLQTADGLGSITLLSFSEPASSTTLRNVSVLTRPGFAATNPVVGSPEPGTAGNVDINGTVLAQGAAGTVMEINTNATGGTGGTIAITGGVTSVNQVESVRFSAGNETVTVDGDINLGSGALILASQTTGAVTVQGMANAGSLDTGTGDYTISLLGGGTINDPTFQNVGGVTLGSFFSFPAGATLDAVTLNSVTIINGGTGGITLGTVNQGTNAFGVIGDVLTFNGAWTGTGIRLVSPASEISMGLAGAPGAWQLTTADINVIQGGGPSEVFIGLPLGASITSSFTTPTPLTANSFTFNAPLFIVASSITINGTITMNTGSLALMAVNGNLSQLSSAGPITGSVDLAGPLEVVASSAVFDSIVGGQGGQAAAANTILLNSDFGLPVGPGPYTVNGFSFVNGAPPSAPPPTPTPTPTSTTSQDLSQGNAAAVVSSLVNSAPGAITNPTSTNPASATASALAASLTIVPPPANAATGAVSETGNSGNGTTSTADAAAGYVVVSSNTGPVTQSEPQSRGNSKTVAPYVSEQQNIGTTGGPGDNRGEVPNPASF